MRTGLIHLKKSITATGTISVFVILLGILLCYGCGHNAEAPIEKIASYPIKQSPSTLEIPITLKNVELENKLSGLFKDPIVDSIKNTHVDFINPALLQFVPYTYVTKGTCDIIGKIHTGGWLCKVNPACWITGVIGHKTCDIVNKGMHWVETTKATRVIFDVPVHYKVRLNQIRIEGNGNTIFLHINLGYAVSANIKGKFLKTDLVSCGFDKDGLAQVELLLTANINIDEHGNLILSNKSYNISWPKACDLSVLNITPQDILNLPFIKGVVDRNITFFVQNRLPNSVSVRDQLAKIWPKVAKPFKLDNQAFINVNPQSLDLTQIFVSKDSIFTEIGSECQPQIFTSDTLPTKTTPMPTISDKKIGDGFNVNILGSANFKQINEYLKPIIEKYKDISDLLRIDEMKCYQSSDSIVVQISLSKPFHGKLYLWGIPRFDLTSNSLQFESLRLTTSSTSVLSKYAGSLIANKTVEKEVQKLFRYKYGKNLLDLIQKYKYFNKELAPNIYLIGHLNKVAPAFINISDNNINVVVNVAGEAYIKMR